MRWRPNDFTDATRAHAAMQQAEFAMAVSYAAIRYRARLRREARSAI